MTDFKLLSSTVVHKNAWFSVREDHYEENGKKKIYSVVDRLPCLVAIPVTPSGRTILLKHFRYPTQEISWEFPMGSRDSNESDEAGAKRELQEETGLLPNATILLGHFFVAPGLTSQKAVVFVMQIEEAAVDTIHIQDTTEDILEWESIPILEIPKAIASGRITDGVTIAAHELYLSKK